MRANNNYLNKSVDLNDASIVSSLDELSLWSAPFGLMMMDHIPIRKGMTVLDIGFGLGFPLLEIAQRLGDSSKVYGIDPWAAAGQRAKEKAETIGIHNIQLLEGDASKMPFDDCMFDLIVSNTGINNFQNTPAVLKECFRVMAPDGIISLTTNPAGHMIEFYEIYEQVLIELNLKSYLENLYAQRDHRLSPGAICQYLQHAEFKINATHSHRFRMRFADAGAFFNHSLIVTGFLDGWKSIIPTEHYQPVFQALEEKINQITGEAGEWIVTIPTLYVEGEKPANP